MLKGTVTTGKGWHSKHMEHWHVLPFAAFPGTLNVEVGEDQVAVMLEGASLGADAEGRRFPYRMGTLNGIEVAVTDSGAVPSEVEVLAAVRLRDLPLDDGDTVTIILSDAVE